jgi:hypothetical protein
LFTGFIDWGDTYRGPTHAAVDLTLSDGFEILDDPRPLHSSQGAGELSGARINRILDSVGWAAGDRDIATGHTTLQATTLDESALTELQLVADTEIGELYIDGAGQVVFRSRHAILTESRSTVSQATFGSDRAAGELPYVGIEIEYKRPLANIVRITREGGIEQVAQVDARYRRTYERSDLIMQNDTDAANYAGWVLGMTKDAEYRFASVTIDPRAMPDVLYPQVLGRRIGDRVTVIRRPPGGGAPIERDAFIRGIGHFYGPGRWLTEWTLESATKYASGLVLDQPVIGKLNLNRLAF